MEESNVIRWLAQYRQMFEAMLRSVCIAIVLHTLSMRVKFSFGILC